VKSVATVVRVPGVEASCVKTIVVPVPTTAAALRRKSGGMLKIPSNCAVDRVSSWPPETMSQRTAGWPVRRSSGAPPTRGHGLAVSGIGA